MAQNNQLWILDLNAKAISPIYTGEINTRRRPSGNKLLTRKSGDNHAVVSIFGIIRRYAEQIYRERGQTRTCDIGKNSKGCGKCITCDLFGSLGKKGRVIFEYLKSKKSFKDVVDPTHHNNLDTETGQVKAFIEVEQIKEGTEFGGKIIIRNPKQKDLEVILSALEAAEEQGIGGWTKRDMGRIKFDVTVNKIVWSDYIQDGIDRAKQLLGGK